MKTILIHPFVLVFGVFASLGIITSIVSVDSEPPDPEATYVGMQTCISSGCHEDKDGSIYQGAEEFSRTMHANIHNRPTPENVIIDEWFENDTMLYWMDTKGQDSAERTVFIDLSKRETADKYYMRFRTVGTYADTTEWYKVAYNYGGNGWLQRFLLEIDGHYYVSPFQYVLDSYRDTENISGKIVYVDERRWTKFDDHLGAVFFLDTRSNDFLKASWDHDCSACHVNGFDVERLELNDNVTEWTAKWVGSHGNDSAIKDINIAVGCESCHGPGSNHVADPENKEYQELISPGDWDATEDSRYWTDRKLDVCNQCHNRHRSSENIHRYQYDDANQRPYLPRLELNNFIRDPLADASYWNDGVTSAAHHQQGQDYWRSGHYENHVFTNGCVDCHKAHSNSEYPYQLDRNWYSLKRGEGCLAFGCHIEKADTTVRDGEVYNVHAQHLNQHSQCVNCHYSKTISISSSGVNEFSDHSDKVIRPTATLLYKGFNPNNRPGAPNTCAINCHRNGYGERNRPDAFDRNASIRYSMGDTVTPMRAPDYGITDERFEQWNDLPDRQLADSLWLGYQRLYPQYMSVREGEALTAGSGLTQVFPNPATEEVSFNFDVQHRERVRVEIYDNRGTPLRIVSEGDLQPGSYSNTWELEDEFYTPVPNGIYFIRIIGESFNSVKSVVVRR